MDASEEHGINPALSTGTVQTDFRAATLSPIEDHSPSQQQPQGTTDSNQAPSEAENLERTEFSKLLRKWADQTSGTRVSDLISFRAAKEIVRDALLGHEQEVKVPLLPSVYNRDDAIAFSRTLLKSPELPKSKTAEGWIKIEDAKIANTAVIALIEDLRRELPMARFELTMRWEKNSKPPYPVFCISMRVGMKIAENGAPALKPAERVRFVLPANAPKWLLQAEANARTGADNLYKLVKSRHEQLKRGEILLDNGRLVTWMESPLNIDPDQHKFSREQVGMNRDKDSKPLNKSTTLLLATPLLLCLVDQPWIGLAITLLHGSYLALTHIFRKQNNTPIYDPITITTPCLRNLALDIIELGYTPKFVKYQSGSYEKYALEVHCNRK